MADIVRVLLASCLALEAMACGGISDPLSDEGEGACVIEALPFAGSADAPEITDVGLELQDGVGVVPVATATDPQGFANVDNVLQSVGVYPDAQCEGVPFTLLDNLVGLGVEETFGTAIDASETAIYSAISAAPATWPVRVDFSDVDGNHTMGDVLARLIR